MYAILEFESFLRTWWLYAVEICLKNIEHVIYKIFNFL